MQSVKGEMKAPGSCLDQWTCVRERWMHKEPVAICSLFGEHGTQATIGEGDADGGGGKFRSAWKLD